MEELKSNVTQISPPLESEGNSSHLHKNGMQKETDQEPILDDPPRNVFEEGHAPMKVHPFYFVKLWPSILEVRIEKAKKLMEKIKQEVLQISTNIEERKVC
jgi:hypothetical protein